MPTGVPGPAFTRLPADDGAGTVGRHELTPAASAPPGEGGGFESCEVKINGVLHEPSTAALAAMPWPRTEKMSTAKVFLLLAHRAEDTSQDA